MVLFFFIIFFFQMNYWKKLIRLEITKDAALSMSPQPELKNGKSEAALK